MKKLFLVFAIAGSLVACDNAANTADDKKDSLDSVTNLQKESVENAAEDAKENLDSTSKAAKDSVDAATGHSTDTTNHQVFYILYSLNILKIKRHMKKFLGVLAIAATLVACDNSGEGKTGDSTSTTTTDTTTITNTTVAPADTTAPLTGADTTSSSTTTTTDTTNKQ